MGASSKLVAASVVTVGVAVGAGWYLNRRLAARFQKKSIGTLPDISATTPKVALFDFQGDGAGLIKAGIEAGIKAAAGGPVLARANALLAAAAPLSLVKGVLLDDDMVRIILKQLSCLDGIAAMRVCTAWCTAWREVRPPTPQHPGPHQALGEVTLTHCTHRGRLLPIKWINPCAFFFQWEPGNEQMWVYLDSHAQYVQVGFKLDGRSLSMALGGALGDAPPQSPATRSANPYALFQEKRVWLQVLDAPHNGRFALLADPQRRFERGHVG